MISIDRVQNPADFLSFDTSSSIARLWARERHDIAALGRIQAEYNPREMTRTVLQSPQETAKPFKTLRRFLAPTRNRLKAKWLQSKYSDHAVARYFDWDWKRLHFNRIALVNLLVSQKKDCAYLEIGCELNDLFDSVAALNKVGVDPQRGGTVKKTSDEFFSTNNLTFDVVFLDGLHTYEQLRTDVINSIRFLRPGGWIALHDLLPTTWIEEHVPDVGLSAGWTGDVWKVALELAKSDGIDFKLLKIDHGVGVLRLTKDNPTLADLGAELSDKRFAYFCEHISEFSIVEWDAAQDWLRNT